MEQKSPGCEIFFKSRGESIRGNLHIMLEKVSSCLPHQYSAGE